MPRPHPDHHPDTEPSTAHEPTTQDRRRVAVVGAGVAGLTCGRTLTDQGFHVTVFDKGRAPGGRTATRRLDPGLAFDHGAQYFTARNPDFIQTVCLWRERGIVAEWTGRIVQLKGGVSTDTTPQVRYIGVPGMSAVAAHLAADLAVSRSTRITRVSRTSSGWQLVEDTNVEHGPFDFLVLALPAPQTATLLAPHPFASEALAIPMTPCWAVLVAFATRFDVPWDGAFVHDSPLSWVARNGSKPGRPEGADCWVLHASPAWSAAHLDESPDAIVPQMIEAWNAAVGGPIPNPVYQTAHRWRYSLGADPAGRGVLFDAQTQLVVCGDWLSGGRVEGAFLSGTQAAEYVRHEVRRHHPTKRIVRHA